MSDNTASVPVTPDAPQKPEGAPVPLRRSVLIRNQRGLHARAAAKLVTLAEKHCSCLSVTHDGQTVPACSIMGLMMLGAGQGATVLLEAEGWDARETLDEVAALIEAGFHEE
ncbi:HPr family phosphocarrier protein [Roseomonas chloroacetimidivorans]|jgi:phosphocarrier protein|uniref:HPr family phosphocarrier protein n=1 Tax=Roseomonas chloroacetimidivorans TaxID=1766656 RepID=UPI003C74A392